MDAGDLKKKLEEIIGRSPDQDPERVAKRKSIVEKMMGSMGDLTIELAKIKETAAAMSRPNPSQNESAKNRAARELAHFDEVKRIYQEQCEVLETIVKRTKRV